MPGIGAAWQKLSNGEKAYWNKEANKLVMERVMGCNLFVRNLIIML